MLYQQSSAEAIHDGTKHLVQIRLRIQFAAELNESFSIVVAGAIKELIDALLNPFANRVEQQCSYGDCQDHACWTGTGHASVDQFRDGRNHRKIGSHDCRCRQGVHHAALEDQVHIHQAIAEYRVAEGQWQ